MTSSDRACSPESSYELLIFDWDGTLADSTKQIVSTMQAVINELKLPFRSEQAISNLIGLSLADGFQRLYAGQDSNRSPELIEAYRRKASATALAAPLFEGVLSALTTLYGAGYRLAVATGKSRRGLNYSLSIHQNLAPLLEVTRCADESAPKPDPLMLQQILETACVPPERALVIGDTEYDVAMARSINVAAVGVCTGAHDGGRLLDAGARAVIDDVGCLPHWLHSIFANSTMSVIRNPSR